MQFRFVRSEIRCLNRRRFIYGVGLAAAALPMTNVLGAARRRISANEKLNIGIIGVAGQGGFSISNLKDQNIVALCDVDEKNLGGAGEKFPEAKRYRDFRRLVDQQDIDAIVVATPDHTHAVATAAALRSGRDVYCEKPLTHTVSEARAITELAAKQKAITQIGTQIHAGNNYRRVVELVQSGAVGAVKEVHVWVASSYGGKELPKEAEAVPPHLDWNLWLGPVRERPYHKGFVPFWWRDWWAFGGGSLADFGCHFMDLPFWALGLSHPDAVEAVGGPAVHTASTPPWLIVRYEFPTAKGTLPLTWYHGGRRPEQLVPGDLFKSYKSGVMFVGEKGNLVSDYGKHALLPEEQFRDFKRPDPFIANSVGHHKEWVEAIKSRGQTTCHFGYSGPLTEAALLGNVAYRVGKKLEWDAKKLRAKNSREAEQFIQHHYRNGWEL